MEHCGVAGKKEGIKPEHRIGRYPVSALKYAASLID